MYNDNRSMRLPENIYICQNDNDAGLCSRYRHREAVMSFTVEWRVKYTISFAFTYKRALLVVTTFKRHAASVCQITM